MQQFYETGVKDILSGWGKVSRNDRDATLKRGSRCADYVAASEGLIRFIEGFEAIEWYDKTSTDCRGHVVELNLENFFNGNLCELDQMSR